MRRSLRLLGFVAAVVAGGCDGAGDAVPTFPVGGRVTQAGKPLAHATVIFHPAGEGPRPRGKTDADGVFRLTTVAADDGAPAGRYRVTVERWATPNPERGPVNQVAPRFADPASSGLTAEVVPGQNEFGPWAVTK